MTMECGLKPWFGPMVLTSGRTRLQEYDTHPGRLSVRHDFAPTDKADTALAGTRARASTIGAAAARFFVKQPAAAHGSSLTTSATSRRTGLSPAWTPA